MKTKSTDPFIQKNEKAWTELSTLLDYIESNSVEDLSHKQARRLITLYRRVASNLNQARHSRVHEDITEYLHSLTSRAYSIVYRYQSSQKQNVIRMFFAHTFPNQIRESVYSIALSTCILLIGGIFGALACVIDADSTRAIIPDAFVHVLENPSQHASERTEKTSLGGGSMASFSSSLFINNSRVAIIAFVLGITLGIGTTAILFYNGAILGVVVALFAKGGETLYLASWIMPHGVIEIPCIILGGAAGFVLAKSMLFPASKTRHNSILSGAKKSITIILGAIAFLALAGVIEGTISQLHYYSLRIPKVILALCLLAGFVYYLFVRPLKQVDDSA